PADRRTRPEGVRLHRRHDRPVRGRLLRSSLCAQGRPGHEQHLDRKRLQLICGIISLSELDTFSGDSRIRRTLCSSVAWPAAHTLSSTGVMCRGTEVYDGMKTSLKCHCGQRVLRRDVMQQGYYMRQYGPSYVYIKYRCSRCKKLGEHFVKQEEWEDSVLSDSATELNTGERTRLSNIGAITL